MNLKNRYQLRNFRFPLVILVMALSMIGILVVGSAKPSLQSRQIFGVVLGVIVMLVVALFDYNWVLKFYWLMYIVNIILLVLVNVAAIGSDENLHDLILCQVFDETRRRSEYTKNNHQSGTADSSVIGVDRNAAEPVQYDLYLSFILCSYVFRRTQL